MNFFVDGYAHLGSDNVVLRVFIGVHIQAKNILIGFVNFLGMQRPKLPIWPWITKIKSELACLNLNRKRISCGRSEVDGGPRLLTKCPQNEDLQANQDEGGSDQTFGSSGKSSDLGSRFPAREHPDENPEHDLRGQEADSRFDHCVR